MRIALTNKQQESFFAHAYPARALLATSMEVLREPDQIVGYNSRGKIFNVFASKTGGVDLGGTWLCVTYDQDTDELEILSAAVIAAGREVLYQPDEFEESQPATELFDVYREQAAQIAEEVQAMTERMRRH